jgi:hypothetical protein
MRDEGIVQPFLKKREQLSRRLHQKCAFPGEIRGARYLGESYPRACVQSQRRNLSHESAAYIAGLIDGEGTITMSRLHAGENRRLVVSISNTEIQLLEFVLEQVAAGKITRKRVASPRHTPSYCYSVSGRQALALIGQLLPWLKSYKRRRAELAITSYVALTPRNGKYSADALARRRLFETDFLSMVPATRAPRKPG